MTTENIGIILGFIISIFVLVRVRKLSILKRLKKITKDSSFDKNSSPEHIEEISVATTRQFSAASKKRLSQCHPDLQKIVNAVLQEMDIAVLCGYRGEVEQNQAVADKRSKLKYPHSKHNQLPSRAVDIAPYPINWNDIERFKEMCLIVEAKAKEFNIKIRLGRDFSFLDFVHFELI